MFKETELSSNNMYKYIKLFIYGISFSTFLDVLKLTTSKRSGQFYYLCNENQSEGE